VYSDDIPAISKIAEKVIMENEQIFYDQPESNHQLFYELVTTGYDFVNHEIPEPLKLPDFYLPYYEGLNKYANAKYWLGIYRRNELYPLGFLKDICMLCLKTRLGQLYTTPWKSLLIKGIAEYDRTEWGIILNKYRVNVRHASNELNWQLENLNPESLELKKQLVREFEEHDLRTYRLCFAIKMQPKTGLPGSIIIKKQGDGLFDILYTKDFNPNSKDFVVYKKEVKSAQLGENLIALCNYFYGLLIDNSVSPILMITNEEEAEPGVVGDIVYQCQNCLSIYDKTFGDEINGVAPDTDFETLNHYSCPVCESSKESFLPVEKKLIYY
jgi:rubredoxin